MQPRPMGQVGQNNTPLAFYWDMPPITRALFTAFGGLKLVAALGIVPIQLWSFLSWELVFYHWQVYSHLQPCPVAPYSSLHVLEQPLPSSLPADQLKFWPALWTSQLVGSTCGCSFWRGHLMFTVLILYHSPAHWCIHWICQASNFSCQSFTISLGRYQLQWDCKQS